MAKTKTHTIGIVMNGVTGRMGTNQHLMRSILAIIKQGGIKVADNETIMPEVLLVGRNPDKLKTNPVEVFRNSYPQGDNYIMCPAVRKPYQVRRCDLVFTVCATKDLA